MGHEIRFETYPTSINTKKIAAEIDDYAKHATWGEGGGGLPFPIRWLNETYATREDAEEAIERRCTNSYAELAVKFYERPRDYKPTQAYTDLEERLQAARRYNQDANQAPSP